MSNIFYLYGIEESNEDFTSLYLLTTFEEVENLDTQTEEDDYIIINIENGIIPDGVNFEEYTFINISLDDFFERDDRAKNRNTYQVKKSTNANISFINLFEKLYSDINDLAMNKVTQQVPQRIDIDYDSVDLVVENVKHGNYAYVQMESQVNSEFRFIVDCNKTSLNMSTDIDSIFVLTHWHQDHSRLLENINPKFIPNFHHIILPPEPIFKMNHSITIIRVRKLYNIIKKLKSLYGNRLFITQYYQFNKSLNLSKIQIAKFIISDIVFDVYQTEFNRNINRSSLLVGVYKNTNNLAACKWIGYPKSYPLYDFHYWQSSKRYYDIVFPGDVHIEDINDFVYYYLIFPHHACSVGNIKTIQKHGEFIISRNGKYSPNYHANDDVLIHLSSLKHVDLFCTGANLIGKICQNQCSHRIHKRCNDICSPGGTYKKKIW